MLIILSMLFSASESAFLAINKLRLRLLRRKNNKKAQLAGKLLDDKSTLLNTILVGNNIVNIAITSILTALSLELFGARGVEVAALGATVVLLIFGEITPKIIGSTRAERTAFLLSPFLRVCTKLLSPLVRIFTAIAEATARLCGINTREKTVSFTEEEIKTFIDAGAEEGVIENGEKHMLRQVFKFSDLCAKEIMVPRTHITALPLDASYEEVLQTVSQTEFSRFPVYKTSLDDICGILYVKDLLYYDGTNDKFSLKAVMRRPLFVLENRRISSIRKIFRENRQTLAIVVDEYSGTEGLVTKQDITHEIFGNTFDPRAENAAAHPSTDENSFTTDGTTRLSELAEKLSIPLESEFYDTIGGYISEQYGNIPTVGVTVRAGEWSFTVSALDGRRVSKVLVHKTEGA